MITKSQVVLALAGMLAAAAGLGADDKADKEDMGKLKGTWTMVSGERGGEKAPDEFVNGFKLKFGDDGKLTVTLSGGDQDGTYKVDASKKPKTMDVTVSDRTVRCVYELKGDELRIAHSPPGDDERPKELKSPNGTQISLLVMKRMK